MALNIGGLSPRESQVRQERLNNKQPQPSGQSEAICDGGGRDLEELTPAALLQRFSDSVDEMSILLAQFRNRRDFEKKVGSTSDNNFEQVLDDEAMPKVYVILKIAAGTEGESIVNLLRHARSLFPDDSDLVLVLRELLRRRDIDQVVKGRLKALLEQVEQRANPRRLKAGINVALKARLFGKALDLSPAMARESYRDFLESDVHEVELYQDWIATYGAVQRSQVVDFMESSLLTDMDAQDPSCSKIEFGSLLQRLVQIKLIRSSDSAFLLAIFKNPLIYEFNSDERKWLLFFFCVLQRPAEIRDFLDDLLKVKLLISRHRERGSILQTVYQACVQLPQQLFLDHESIGFLAEEFERLLAIVYEHEQLECVRERGEKPTAI